MLGWVVATALLGGGEGEVGEELKQICAQFQKVENYTFSTKTESSGGGFGRGGGEPEAPWVGQFIQDTPIHFSQGELEAYLDDGQLIYKSEQDGWATFDAEAMRGGRGGGGGRGRGGDAGGGDAGGGDAGGGDAGGARGGRRRGGQGAGGGAGEGGDDAGPGGRRERREPEGGNSSARQLRGLSRVKLPHDLLSGFDAKVNEVVRAEADGKVTYSGKLTEDGVRAMSSFGGRGGRGGRDGGGGPDFKYSGTFELSMGAEGQLEQLVFNTTVAGSFGDRDFERSTKQTIQLSEIGKTEFEVPAEALSKFEL